MGQRLMPLFRREEVDRNRITASGIATFAPRAPQTGNDAPIANARSLGKIEGQVSVGSSSGINGVRGDEAVNVDGVGFGRTPWIRAPTGYQVRWNAHLITYQSTTPPNPQ